MLMLGRLEAEGLFVTTCSYGIPHYHLEIRKTHLTGRQPRSPRGELDVWPFDDWRIRVEDITPDFGAPVFFFPGLVLGSWVRDFPVRSIRYGRSDRFGHFVLSEFGTALRRKGEGQRLQKWGEVTLEADWREKRGGGWGLSLDYGWGGSSGYVHSYYLHDLGRDPDIDFDRKFPPLEHEDRGRVRAFHRTDWGEHWRFEAETWYFSDRSLQEEFFEKEFKEDKEPETAVYIRWLDGCWGAFLYERHRLNDFQTQNEYLPRTGFWMLSHPPVPSIFDTLTLTVGVDVAHLRRRYDEEAHRPAGRAWRADAISELLWAWEAGPFQASPFLQQRTTLYEEERGGEESHERSLWSVGGRISTQIHGTHPEMVWEAVGLRGLRHVIELEARFAASLHNTVAPSELFFFDEVDLLDEFREASFEMRHRFRTKGADGRPFDFLDVGLEFEYYPDPDRDTVLERVDNILLPFNWIALAPEPGTELYPRRRVSNLHYEIVFCPGDFLRLTALGEYNPEARREEVREWSVWVSPWPAASVSLSQTFVRGLTDAYRVAVGWDLTEKWRIGGAIQYDFRADRYVTQELVLAREFHDFSVEFVAERDFGRDESRFHVGVVPKFAGLGRTSRFSRFAGEP